MLLQKWVLFKFCLNFFSASFVFKCFSSKLDIQSSSVHFLSLVSKYKNCPRKISLASILLRSRHSNKFEGWTLDWIVYIGTNKSRRPLITDHVTINPLLLLQENLVQKTFKIAQSGHTGHHYGELRYSDNSSKKINQMRSGNWVEWSF